MTVIDRSSLAHELMAAYASSQLTAPPSARDAGFDLDAAYGVEAELVGLRRAGGHITVGRKVGFANRAVWRVLKLDTLVWAHMYDDTVRYARDGMSSLSLDGMCSPKIEPEVVFKLRTPIAVAESDPAAVLGCVEWVALGFEIIDCVYPEWKFTPADFVAAFGLHAALIIGEPTPVRPETIPDLVDQLATFRIALLKNGVTVDEGSGKNSLRSPVLCLGELAAATARQSAADPLAAGELVSSGTLTTAQPIAPGETWTVAVQGLDVSAPTLTL